MELFLEGAALDVLMRVQRHAGEEQDTAYGEVPADESVHGGSPFGWIQPHRGTSSLERRARPRQGEVLPVVLGACTQVWTCQLRENGEVAEAVIRVVLADDH